MIIKSIMTDEDRKALEYMLSLEYAMPYQLLYETVSSFV